MNSAARKRSSRSVISSSPKIAAPTGSSLPHLGQQHVEPALLFGAHRHDRGERNERGELRHLRQQQIALLQAVDLVQRDDHAGACRQQADHRTIGVRGPSRLDHEDRRVDVGEALRDRLVHPVVQARAVLRLESRRVDEDELRIGPGHDTGDAMARRLRLPRRDADLRADQAIDQRRLADVRPADDRDVAAAKALRRRRVSHRVRHRARPSPPRTLAPLPPARRRDGSFRCRSATMPSAAIRHSIVNVCACASPSTAITAYSGSGDAAGLQPFLQAGLRILAERRGVEIDELRRVDAQDHRAVPRRSRRRRRPHRISPRAHRRGSTAARRPRSSPRPRPRRISVGELEAAREPRERVAIDEARAHARQLAFGNRRESLEQRRARSRSSTRRRRRIRAARCESRRSCGASAPGVRSSGRRNANPSASEARWTASSGGSARPGPGRVSAWPTRRTRAAGSRCRRGGACGSS